MKRNIFILLFAGYFLVGPVGPAVARFTIPDDAYRMGELEDALQEAKNEDWPLTFLLAHEKTDCPIGTKASLDAISELEAESIIVYVNAFANEISICPKIIEEPRSKLRGIFDRKEFCLI
jgi:hypothetical protein